MRSPTIPVRYRDGLPVYRYDPSPGTAPVHAFRLDPDHPPNGGSRHIHDFPVVLSDGSSAWVARPGVVMDPTQTDIPHGCVAIAFDPSVVDPLLLGPTGFQRGGELLRVTIAPERRAAWRWVLRQIEQESEERLENHHDALVAHLVVLLIELRRHASDEADLPDESLQAVFTAIEDGFDRSLTLRDVARSVGLTPGYLTTRVRKLTGKTVQEWIVERRLVEARRLLAESDVPITAVARQAGFNDPAYFTRVFTREVGIPPRRWRAELRAQT